MMRGFFSSLGWLRVGGLGLAVVLCGGCNRAAPVPAADGSAVADDDPDVPNAYLGLPFPINPNARLAANSGFDAKKIFLEDSNGYPGCETPDPNTPYGWTPVAGCPATPIGTQVPLQSFCHIDPNFRVSWWQSNPPACGDHWPQPSRQLGINRTPVARESWVHSMEHGAVILGYNCPDGCDAKLAVLERVQQARSERSYKVLVTPDPQLPPNTLSAVAWTWIYLYTEPDFKTLICFIDEHFNHGRENDKVL